MPLPSDELSLCATLVSQLCHTSYPLRSVLVSSVDCQHRFPLLLRAVHYSDRISVPALQTWPDLLHDSALADRQLGRLTIKSPGPGAEAELPAAPRLVLVRGHERMGRRHRVVALGPRPLNEPRPAPEFFKL